jgi:hypothetical protein
MKRIINQIVALAGCVLLAGIVSAKVTVTDEVAAPKLVNPSFETPGDSADTAAGWGRWGDWFNREDSWTPVLTGHCILGYQHWQIANAKDSGVFQDVQGAVKGTSYTFGIFVNPDKAKAPSQDALKIELRLESIVDGQPKTVASKVYYVADLKADEWKLLTVAGAPENDTLRVLVIVTPSPVDGTRGGAIRFDDASLDLTH